MHNPLAPGARIGAYELNGRLGAGGMGEVYRARDTRLGRTVAIKVLRAGADPDLLHRLQREARAASALNHPNIVHIYDVGEDAGAPGAHYVVMEYVEGETLRRHLARGPLPIPELLELGSQIADGLAKAHLAGIVHRDLKPENLMITPEGVVKILDFGLAKLAPPLEGLELRETLSRHATQAGMLVGTLEYMSPEQATGRVVDHRTDQFALGLTLHEMATGHPPFRRETPAQVLAAVIERDPEPLGRLRSDVPARLEALVTRCLQKEPRNRFARTDELATELATLAASPPAAEGISAERVPAAVPQPSPGVSSVYHVQQGERVRVYDEAQAVKLIRKRKLTGTELVRRDDEDLWQPLIESRLWRRALPVASDPLDAARREALRGLGAHFIIFSGTGAVLYATQGQLPFWMGIWAVWLGMHLLGCVASAWPLLKRSAPNADPAPAGAALPAHTVPKLPPAAGPGGASPVAQEVARVRALMAQRGGSDAARLVGEVDGILRLTEELATWEADLQEQTSGRERAALAAAIADARGRLDRADVPESRRLFERQLEVLQNREEAIAKAVRVLERLRVRRDLAEHQLKQLRLDLSRGAAGGLDVPELSSRLQFIRYEVDAREQVAQIAAGDLPRSTSSG